MRPVDGITLDEAAHIIGCSLRQMARHIEEGRLPAGPKNQRYKVSRPDAEALALQLRSSRAGRSTATRRIGSAPRKPHASSP